MYDSKKPKQKTKELFNMLCIKQQFNINLIIRRRLKKQNQQQKKLYKYNTQNNVSWLFDQTCYMYHSKKPKHKIKKQCNMVCVNKAFNINRIIRRSVEKSNHNNTNTIILHKTLFNDLLIKQVKCIFRRSLNRTQRNHLTYVVSNNHLTSIGSVQEAYKGKI